MTRLSVRMKLLGTSMVGLAAAMAITVVTVNSLDGVGGTAGQAYTHTTYPLEKLGLAESAIANRSAAVTYSVVAGTDATAQASVAAQIAADGRAIDDNIAAIAPLLKTADETQSLKAVVAQIQQGTKAAVEAMEAGAVEVETGAELADQAAGALTEIKDAADARDVVLEDMLAAVVEIRTLSADVVRATDGISEIAAETNTAAAEMRAAADTVGISVESIAAVSQENSASAEEVAAAAEQMSAQAEEVVASAATLAEMAAALDELMARFRLETNVPVVPGNVIPRRRASDWALPNSSQTRSA